VKKRKNKGEAAQDNSAPEFENILTGETDVAIDENGNPYNVDSKQKESMFTMSLDEEEETILAEKPAEEPVATETPTVEKATPVEEVNPDVRREEMRDKTVKSDNALNPGDPASNESHMAKPVDAPEQKKEEFPIIVAPTFKAKGKGKRATYNKDEVDAHIAELVERYNANMMRLEKTHLKSVERKKTIERIFKDIATKQETLKTLVAKIHELEDEAEQKVETIRQLEETLTQKDNQIEELLAAPPQVVEITAPEPVVEEPVVEEPVVETPVEIPVFDEETILSHTISVKLEEAEMEAHRIKLHATSQATDILAEAQSNASELMRQAEVEIEELTRSITEAAEAKLVDAEKRQAQVTKLAKERQTVHRRLIRMYNQQIGRLEKQIKSYDDIINSPSE